MKNGNEILADLPFRWGTQGKIFIIGGLGYMFDAWDVALSGVVIPLLATSDWNLNALQLGIFGTIALIGMAIGAFSWGSITDLLGRKFSFSLTMLVFSVFSLLCAIAPNYTSLVIFRFIAGLGLGGCIPVDYSLVSEFMPKRKRGVLLSLMNIWYPIGATAAGVGAVLLSPFDNWRLFFLVMVIPALLVFWIRRDIPESPLYLAQRGKTDKADSVLKMLASRTGAKLPKQWVWPEKPQQETKNLLAGVVNQFKQIWTFNWKITLAIWLMFSSILLLYYGVLTWLPTILVDKGYSNYAAYLINTYMTSVGIAGTLLSAWLVEVWGRKIMLVIGGVLGGVAMVGFSFQIYSVSLVSFWILFFGFTIELALPALYAYASEVYPTKIRGTGFGWASTLSRIAAGSVPAVFGSFLWPVFGLKNTFITMLIFITVSVCFMFFVAPETKGKSLDSLNYQSEKPKVMP